MSKQRGRIAQAAKDAEASELRGRVELRPLFSRRARDLIEAYHYLKSWPYVGNKLLSLGIFLDGRLVGVMVWGWPGFPAKADLWGSLDKAGNPSRDGVGNPLPTSHQVICLHRMWVADGTPGNIESHALNLALRRRGSYPSIVEELYLSVVKPPKFHDEPYRLLLAVTYTDVELHTGTTYRAAGWQRWGESESDGWGDQPARRLCCWLKRLRPHGEWMPPVMPLTPKDEVRQGRRTRGMEVRERWKKRAKSGKLDRSGAPSLFDLREM